MYLSICCDKIQYALGDKTEHQIKPLTVTSTQLQLLLIFHFKIQNRDCLYVDNFDRSFILMLEIWLMILIPLILLLKYYICLHGWVTHSGSDLFMWCWSFWMSKMSFLKPSANYQTGCYSVLTQFSFSTNTQTEFGCCIGDKLYIPVISIHVIWSSCQFQ